MTERTPSGKPGIEVWLLRHGESRAQSGEETGLDTGLSGSGKRQAQAAGAFLKGFSFDLVLVSPLKRAEETFFSAREGGLSCTEACCDSRLIENMPYGGYLPLFPRRSGALAPFSFRRIRERRSGMAGKNGNTATADSIFPFSSPPSSFPPPLREEDAREESADWNLSPEERAESLRKDLLLMRENLGMKRLLLISHGMFLEDFADRCLGKDGKSEGDQTQEKTGADRKDSLPPPRMGNASISMLKLFPEQETGRLVFWNRIPAAAEGEALPCSAAATATEKEEERTSSRV